MGQMVARKKATKPEIEDTFEVAMETDETSEVEAFEVQTSEEPIQEVVEPVEEVLISLDEYIERYDPHRVLVASFTYEAKQVENGLAPRSEDQWVIDFRDQSRRIYKSF